MYFLVLTIEINIYSIESCICSLDKIIKIGVASSNDQILLRTLLCLVLFIEFLSYVIFSYLSLSVLLNNIFRIFHLFSPMPIINWVCSPFSHDDDDLVWLWEITLSVCDCLFYFVLLNRFSRFASQMMRFFFFASIRL